MHQGAGCIGSRWCVGAIGMRMEATDDLRATCPSSAMRSELDGRVNDEAPFWIIGNICCNYNTFYKILNAKQETAGLLRIGALGLCQNFCMGYGCNPECHADIASIMGGAPSNHILSISPAIAGERLDRALATLLPELSRERIKDLIAAGAVVGQAGARLRPSQRVSAGDAFRLTLPDARPAEAVAQDIALDIVFEDDALLVVDKPAGLVVHPAAGNRDGTLVNALLHHCRGRLSGIGGVARPGIVHRIDKDTSGLLVVAKTDQAHEGLARQFAAHSIDRRYVAVVAGRPLPAAGRIEAAIGRHPTHRKKMAVAADGMGKAAVTRYETLEVFDDAAIVECRLETGRTHQVRVHMASIGHPLLGDQTYGKSRKIHSNILKKIDFRRQALHARRLGFFHPASQEKLSFESPVPADMLQLIAMLRR
jgi:23S rRNA pseudouridine1911/1915/1917 synthase